MLRQVMKNIKPVFPYARTLSSKGPLIDLSVDNDGVAVMTMQRLPVNSLNLDLLQELSKSLDEVAKNKTKALILTSASTSTFSAGLDIMELYKPDIKRVELFWTTLQDVWIKLFGSPFVTAAAINGHAPAFGCVLAMSCEYRVMVSGKYTTGLNETAIGIVATRWIMDTMRNTISQRETEFALTTGRMFTVDEALKVGLIDETAADKEDAIKKCKGFIKKFDRIPSLARGLTKQGIRAEPIKWLQDNREADTNVFLGFVKNPNMQESLEMYVQAMKARAANK
ncbi:unnamed protein product [Leptidea sinapis]|uniref:Enoyl-CoA delta isomerase 1, mitochondrial n=1 Tax=Leptidea sinapis TaxID=189913 RepID=A0A5E4QYV9_9NEOP|nr:unnamed protein product [Leptidea sinapis]